MKRFIAFLLIVVLFMSEPVSAFACDENQSNNRITELIFGDEASSYLNDANVKTLLNALYLCSEQSDNQGQDKLDYLKKQKVKNLSPLADINVRNNELLISSHISWESAWSSNSKARTNRRKTLQNAVNKVFDFGFFSNLFGSEKGKCNSFAALLYYFHILSDYLADDPQDTEITIKGKIYSSYCGSPFVEIDGGVPSFSSAEKSKAEAYTSYSSIDGLGRCGVAFAVLGTETMPPSDSRQNIGAIKPSGWNQEKYPDMINSEPAYIYNRCHLIAHQLAGNDGNNNLITGTRYLNETGMKPFEDMVAQYIKETQNHVLYRATPIFERDNLLASGVQLEAYSLEDKGDGICFNVYCYNVQPGIEINYISGKSEKKDELFDSQIVLPFVVSSPSETNPDLLYEITKHLEILFKEKKESPSSAYSLMMNEIDAIATEARNIGNIGEKPAQKYMKMKECEYNLFKALRMYVPSLLKKQDFFISAFGK